MTTTSTEPVRLTLLEIVANVFEADRLRRAETLYAQQRLLLCRIQRDSQIPGMERNVESLRRKLEALG